MPKTGVTKGEVKRLIKEAIDHALNGDDVLYFCGSEQHLRFADMTASRTISEMHEKVERRYSRFVKFQDAGSLELRCRMRPGRTYDRVYRVNTTINPDVVEKILRGDTCDKYHY